MKKKYTKEEQITRSIAKKISQLDVHTTEKILFYIEGYIACKEREENNARN